MTWFAWKGYNGGKAVDIAGSQEKQAVLLGFHGYGTEANPNDVAGLFPDPFLGGAQESFVNLIIADYGFAKRAGEQPGGPHATPTPGNVVAGTAQAGASFAASALGDGFHLVFGNTSGLLGRTIKVLLGATLIIMGVAKLTGTDSTVTSALSKAGKAGMFPGL